MQRVTEPLCGQTWLEEHTLPKCIRCGGCCKAIPCLFAQLYYGLWDKEQQCPALKDNGDGTTTCLRMKGNALLRVELLGTGCDYPEGRGKL